MSTINKLTIKGIRSFGIHKEDEQVIEIQLIYIDYEIKL